MITLFILTLVTLSLVFALVPVVAFALMVETCVERSGSTSAGATMVEEEVPPTLRLASV